MNAISSWAIDYCSSSSICPNLDDSKSTFCSIFMSHFITHIIILKCLPFSFYSCYFPIPVYFLAWKYTDWVVLQSPRSILWQVFRGGGGGGSGLFFLWLQQSRIQHDCFWIMPLSPRQLCQWCQWELAQLWHGRDHLWARMTALMMVWGMSCQSTADFMFLLLKHSFPNWSSRSSHWSNFSIWSSAQSFSLGNSVLHQKIYCPPKAKLFPRALSGISNSSLSLELNFPLDTYSKQMQTSIKTPIHCAVLKAIIPVLFPHFP